MTINIRPLATYKEIDQLTTLQRNVAGSLENEAIPAPLLFALQKQGAALLGAVERSDDEERIVGYLASVLGTVESLKQRRDPIAAARLKMYTLALGVAESHRGQEIGFRLKRAERDFALQIGIRLITFTFDPLDTDCAELYIGRLGAVSHQFWRAFAGSGMAGLAGDRLHAEWWVTSHRAEGRTNQKRRPLSLDQLLGGGARLVNPTALADDGRLLPGSLVDMTDASLKLVEVPAEIGGLARHDPALAADWRTHIREVFETLFLDQFMITDFVQHSDDDGRRRHYYMLAQRNV